MRHLISNQKITACLLYIFLLSCPSLSAGIIDIVPAISESRKRFPVNHKTTARELFSWLLTSHHIAGFHAFSAPNNRFITVGASSDLSVLQSQSTQSNSHSRKHSAGEKQSAVKPGPKMSQQTPQSI